MSTNLLQVDRALMPKQAPGSAERPGPAALLQLARERLRSRVAGLAAQNASDQAVDCERYPAFCDPQLDCARPISQEERHSLDGRLVTAAGHANPRSWCLLYPLHAESVQKCILENDKLGYAEAAYAQQEKLHLVEADAIYCFAGDVCNQKGVTLSTTPEEAEAVCDSSLGGWRSVGWKDFTAMLSRFASEMSHYQHLSEREMLEMAQSETRLSAKVACAMGNYMCDVYYCKRNYCSNEGYRAKYSHLAPAVAP